MKKHILLITIIPMLIGVSCVDNIKSQETKELTKNINNEDKIDTLETNNQISRVEDEPDLKDCKCDEATFKSFMSEVVLVEKEYYDKQLIKPSNYDFLKKNIDKFDSLLQIVITNAYTKQEYFENLSKDRGKNFNIFDNDFILKKTFNYMEGIGYKIGFEEGDFYLFLGRESINEVQEFFWREFNMYLRGDYAEFGSEKKELYEMHSGLIRMMFKHKLYNEIVEFFNKAKVRGNLICKHNNNYYLILYPKSITKQENLAWKSYLEKFGEFTNTFNDD